MDLGEASDTCGAVLDAVSSAVVADRSALETILLGILADGHVLLEDVPGTGKTLTARSFARVLGLDFSRIQFTPDLLPADVTGSHIYDEGRGEFEFVEGPVFANVVLGDELNRAPPKTQSALLETMEERQVTVNGETRVLPAPFFVVGTQNPVESEGVFTLPAAQLDRFAVKVRLGYPAPEAEWELLKRRTNRRSRAPSADPLLSVEEVIALKSVLETVRVDDDVLEYLVRIAQTTRDDERVAVGASPRATQTLLEVARGRAVLDGRSYVTPDHVRDVARPVLEHRLLLRPNARAEDVDPVSVVDDVLGTVAVPTLD